MFLSGQDAAAAQTNRRIPGFRRYLKQAAVERIPEFRVAPAISDFAAGEHNDIVGQNLNVIKDMGGNQDVPAREAFPDRLVERDPFLWIDSGCGLVQNYHLRIAYERGGDANPALHAAGALPVSFVQDALDIDLSGGLPDFKAHIAFVHVFEQGDKAQDIRHLQVGIDIEFLRQIRYHAFVFVRPGINPVDAYGAFGRQNRGQYLEQGGFAAAVFPDQESDPVGQGEADVPQNRTVLFV